MKLWNKIFGYPKRDPKLINITEGMVSFVIKAHTEQPYGIGSDFAFGVRIGHFIELNDRYDIMEGDWFFIDGGKEYITKIVKTRLHTRKARRVENGIPDSLTNVESHRDYFKWFHIPSN